MAAPQIVALPVLRLACRALADHADDGDVVLAEAGALLAWARERGRVSAPWVVIDGDTIEVAAPVPADAALADGLTERRLDAGRWAALDVDSCEPSALKAATSTLRAQPPEPLAADATRSPIFARLTEDGATVHVRIAEQR